MRRRILQNKEINYVGIVRKEGMCIAAVPSFLLRQAGSCVRNTKTKVCDRKKKLLTFHILSHIISLQRSHYRGNIRKQ